MGRQGERERESARERKRREIDNSSRAHIYSASEGGGGVRSRPSPGVAGGDRRRVGGLYGFSFGRGAARAEDAQGKRERKTLKGNPPRVIYHQAYWCMKRNLLLSYELDLKGNQDPRSVQQEPKIWLRIEYEALGPLPSGEATLLQHFENSSPESSSRFWTWALKLCPGLLRAGKWFGVWALDVLPRVWGPGMTAAFISWQVRWDSPDVASLSRHEQN